MHESRSTISKQPPIHLQLNIKQHKVTSMSVTNHILGSKVAQYKNSSQVSVFIQAGDHSQFSNILSHSTPTGIVAEWEAR